MIMIKQECFSREWIEEKRNEFPGTDPQLIERFIHAFELLGHVAKQGDPFIFRGGTALVLHLPALRRLSIDIDVIGQFTLDQVKQALKKSVFNSVEEDTRTSDIPKHHFKAFYSSQVTDQPTYVLLDVLTTDRPYAKTIRKKIQSTLFASDADIDVEVPTLNSLLADKLTAFAPTTIGIRHGSGKTMEIMKQIFDIGELFPHHDDPAEIAETYRKVFEIQKKFLASDVTFQETLDDTIRSAFLLCQIDLKSPLENDATKEFRAGVKQIHSHLLNTTFSMAQAKIAASRAALLAGLLQYTNTPWLPTEMIYSKDSVAVMKDASLDGKLQRLNKLKSFLPECFFNWLQLSRISSNLKDTQMP